MRGSRTPKPGEVETLLDSPTMFRAAQLVGRAVHKVRNMDGRSLDEAGVKFDVSILIGGQIKGSAPRLFMLYAAGNFIECGVETPYLQIGEHKYGKPILDRAVTFNTNPQRRAEAWPDLDGFDDALESRRRDCRSISSRCGGTPGSPNWCTASRRASPISTICVSAGRRRSGPRTSQFLHRPTSRLSISYKPYSSNRLKDVEVQLGGRGGAGRVRFDVLDEVQV